MAVDLCAAADHGAQDLDPLATVLHSACLRDVPLFPPVKLGPAVRVAEESRDTLAGWASVSAATDARDGL
eukprot:3294822-Lingulodinium_polyedra.AAC.1